MVKKYLKTRNACKVTFRVPPEAAREARTAHLVGEFNEWSLTATPMKRKTDGSFEATLTLEGGRSYQFRYLLDGKNWENDWNADAYAPSSFGAAENSVVIV
jgi:1,4-alpha-glucan branching enzyme